MTLHPTADRRRKKGNLLIVAPDASRAVYSGRARSKEFSETPVNSLLVTALFAAWLGQAPAGPALPAEKACQEFGQRLQVTVAGENPSAMDSSFDFKAMMMEGIRTADLPAESRKELASGPPPQIAWGAMVRKQIEEKGSYTFLRVRDQGGIRKALFRIIGPNGVNYHDYHLSAAAGGGVKVTDIYVYQTAECFSESMRRMMLSANLGQGDPSKPLTKSQEEFLDGLRKAGEARELLQKGDPAGYLRVYATLPPAIQRQKGILVLRTMAAAQVGEKEALEAMEDFKKAFPGDPCLDLVSMDPLTKLKKYDKVLDAIDRLDKAVGGDPYLELIRANIHVLDGKPAKAKECAKRCVQREQGLQDAYWFLVSMALQEKAWAETARWLSAIEKNLGLEIIDLTKDEPYAEFIKTSEYKAWMKGRAKK